MARDEFENFDPRKSQSLDQQSVDQDNPLLQQEQAPLGEQAEVTGVKADQKSLDTLPKRRNRWLFSGLVGAGLLAIAAAIAVPRFLPEETSSSNPLPTAQDPSAAVNDETVVNLEQEAAMLLEQAKLLAESGAEQGLVEALAIAKTIPENTDAYSTAQTEIPQWNQELLNARAVAANVASDSNPAVNDPQIVANNAELAELQRQIDQEVALASASRQQTQSAQNQIAALRNSTPSSTTTAPAQPSPNQELIAAEQELAQQQARTQTLQNQLAQAQGQTTALQTQQQQLASQAQQQASTPAAPQQQPVQQVQPPASPQAQPQAQTGNQTPTTASDPYLNVDIAPPSTPQTVAAVPTPVAPPTGNSYGFRNVVVGAPTVAIELRDNVDEDGDFVTLIVNGQVITNYQQIWNRGQVFMVPLQPGNNVVEIIGDKDGTGGITLEANVAGVGNVNSQPIPEGSRASFIITRQ